MCSDPDYIEENPYEEELVRISEEMWLDYQENYIPLENQIIEQTQDKRSASYQQNQQDRAVNEARMQHHGTVTAGAGMNPGHGSFMQTSNTAQQQAGHAGAMGAMAGLQTAEDQYMSGMLGLTQHGRGQQATAMQGTGSLASNQMGMDMAELSAQQYASSAKWGAVGGMAGLGMTAYGDSQGWFDEPTKKTT